MKLFKFIVPFIGIAAVGCTSISVDQVQDNPGSKAETRTFICSIGSPDSKVVTDATGKTQWEVGDEILVHGEYIGTRSSKQYSTIVTLTAGDISLDKKTATISFDVDPDGVAGIVPYSSKYKNQFFAVYPADAAVTTNGFHSYYYSDFTRTNEDLMIAYDKDDMFVFTHVCSAIAFTVPDIDGDPLTNDFDSYIFSGNNGEIVGYSSNYVARYALNTDDSEQKDFPYGGDGVHTCTGPLTEITGPVVCDGSTLNFIYMPIPAGQSKHSFSMGFTIKFVKGGSIVKYVETSTAFTLNRQDFLNIGSIPTDSKLKDYVAPAHNSSIDLASATDLGASETANCYMIDGSDAANASKIFKFKANKGNSIAGVGIVDSVEVLWETYNNATAVSANSIIADVDFDKQPANDFYEIVFKMPASLHVGNAVIAAKNSGGEILWSWHIWVPNGLPTGITDATVFGASPIMDRNLGALVAAPADAAATVESYGLFYQWGRKDPFPGMDAVSHNGAAAVAGTAMTSVDGTLTIAESIKNPTRFARSTDEKDWVTVGEDQSNTLWNTTKTIYDPCPPGYIVPTRNTSVDYWKDVKLNELDAADHFSDNGATNGSYVIGTETLVVFPYTGYIQMQWGDHYKAGIRSYVWSSYASSYNSNIDKAYARFCDNAASSYKRTEKGKSLGASVRCVAE